jgi:ABC-2 type transport system permease protein
VTGSVLLAFLRRDAAIQTSYRAALGLELAATMFTLAMFFYLSRIVDTSELSRETGFDQGYFAFVIVGLAVLEIMHTGLTSLANRIRQDQTTGTLEALMATPTGPSPVVLFSGAFDLLRATALGVAMVVLAQVAFGLGLELDPASIGLSLLALGACVAMFAPIGVFAAAFTIVYKQTRGLVTLLSQGFALLAGAYVPLAILPEPLHTIGEILPFTWGLDALRAALLEGRAEIGRIALLVGFTALLLPVALWVFNRALERARRDGSLAQY